MQPVWNRQTSNVMPSRAEASSAVSDEEIVRRFQETGENECFSELFARYRKRIYFACRGFFTDGGAAEDATQETFLRAYQNMHRFSGGNFNGWLLRIARNVCIDLWRKRRLEAAEEEGERAELKGTPTLDRMSDLHLAIDRMRTEIETLSLDQRRCLELKIDGFTYEETAARTGLSVEAVKSHLQNGRRMLWLKMEAVLSQLK